MRKWSAGLFAAGVTSRSARQRVAAVLLRLRQPSRQSGRDSQRHSQDDGTKPSRVPTALNARNSSTRDSLES